MKRGESPQASRSPDVMHRTLPSSRRLANMLRPVVRTAADASLVEDTELPVRGSMEGPAVHAEEEGRPIRSHARFPPTVLPTQFSPTEFPTPTR
jgi:hypothetical protein